LFKWWNRFYSHLVIAYLYYTTNVQQYSLAQ
jgi:hypothetical protein